MTSHLRRSNSRWQRHVGHAAACLALAAPLGAQGAHRARPSDVPGREAPTSTPGAESPTPVTTAGTPGSSPGTVVGGGMPTPGTPGVGVAAVVRMAERDENDWRIWWRLNRDPLLVVSALQAMPLSNDGGFFLGDEAQRDASRVVKSGVLIESVLPELEAALERETSPMVRSAILIALGRAGELVTRESSQRVLALCAADNGQVREAAVVAAGLQAEPWVTRRLVHVVHGCEAGRAILGERAVDTRSSAFAALSIGLGLVRRDNEDLRRYVVFELARSAAGAFAAADVPAACVVSIGLLPLPWSGTQLPDEARPAPHLSREGQIAWMLQAVEADSVHRQVRGQAALALGRLATDADEDWRRHVAEALVALLEPRSEAGVEVRQGAAIALGMLGDCDQDAIDVRVRRTLLRNARDADALTRRFALLSLARVAARNGSGDPAAGRADLVDFLADTLRSGRSGLDSWAAIGLGTLGRELFRAGLAPERELHAALAAKLSGARSPMTVGAFGLGLSLSQAPGADEELAAALARYGGDEHAAASLSIALGLAGGPLARVTLAELLAETRGRPQLVHDASLALVLSGDFGGTPRLVQAFESATALDSRGALASALGRTGDTRAIDPLVRALEDDDAPQMSRALAARGLGWLVDQGKAPVWSPLSCDLNWGADTTTLAGVAGGDFLELLRDF
jgi:HEAT repeat protein